MEIERGEDGIVQRNEGAEPVRETWPVWPADLVAWAQRYDTALRDNDAQPDSGELLALFAAVRTTARTATAIEEWLLLVCRDRGVTLQDLAEVTAGHPSRESRRRYVSGPSDRELRLRRDFGTAAARLAALSRRPETARYNPDQVD